MSSSKIDEILNDYTHGSTYLIRKYLRFLVEEEPNPERLEKYNQKLLERFADMQIFQHVINNVHEDNLSEKAEEYLDLLDKGPRRIAKKLRSRLPDNSVILTFSYSQAVVDTLQHLMTRKIYCMKSEPGGEGADLAEDIGGELIDDGDLELIADIVSAVVFGCDMYNEQTIVNKVGTKSLCLECRKNSLPVYVLTSVLKQVDEVPKEISDPMLEGFSRDLITELLNEN